VEGEGERERRRRRRNVGEKKTHLQHEVPRPADADSPDDLRDRDGDHVHQVDLVTCFFFSMGKERTR
jgi:hypothetical protein